MKKLLSLLLWSWTVHLHANTTNAIRQFILDPRAVIQIPVSTERLTTVSLPSPLSGLEAAFIDSEPDPLTRFQLSFQSGSAYFSIRALAPNVSANVNVIWHDRVYVLEFQEGRDAALAVNLLAPVPERLTVAPHGVNRLPPTIETARSYQRLVRARPEAASLIRHLAPLKSSDFGNYSVRLDDIFQFDQEDTLIIKATLRNKTAQPLYYLPGACGVVAGAWLMHPDEVEADGVLPGRLELPIYLRFTGEVPGVRLNGPATTNLQVRLGKVSEHPLLSKPEKLQPATGRVHFSLAQ